MAPEDWSFLNASLAHYISVFEEEELTPTILRSFRPWPKALHDALDELGVAKADAPLISDALSSSGAASSNADARILSSAATPTPPQLYQGHHWC